MRSSVSRRRGKRSSRRPRRLIKAFLLGAGLGAVAGLVTPPRQTKTEGVQGELGLKSAKVPDASVKGDQADGTSARRVAASRTSSREVTAKIIETEEGQEPAEK